MTNRNNTYHGKTKHRNFTNPDLINPHLICSVCLDVFQLPHRLLCGHTFCYICIHNCIKISRKHKCPQCKTDFSSRKIQKDLIASKMVDDLQVRCMHNGCKFMGKNAILKRHQRICQHKQKKQCNISENSDNVVVIKQEQQVAQVDQINSEIGKIRQVVMVCDQYQAELSVL